MPGAMRAGMARPGMQATTALAGSVQPSWRDFGCLKSAPRVGSEPRWHHRVAQEERRCAMPTDGPHIAQRHLTPLGPHLGESGLRDRLKSGVGRFLPNPAGTFNVVQTPGGSRRV